MRRVPALLVLAAVAGCSSVAVDADYDSAADLSKLRSYAWFEGPRPHPLDDLTDRRIRTALEEALPTRGLVTVADPKAADVHVAWHCSVRQRIEATPSTVSVGYGWRRGYVGTGFGSEVRTYDEGTLVVDFVDPKTKQLVWRGTARGTVDASSTPERREARIREAVAKILDQFPPRR